MEYTYSLQHTYNQMLKDAVPQRSSLPISLVPPNQSVHSLVSVGFSSPSDLPPDFELWSCTCFLCFETRQKLVSCH